MTERDPAWRAGVATGSLDPFRGYAAALTSHLPDAPRVLDPFHVVRLGLARVDDVRRGVQHAQTGHRGRSRDPLFGIRRVLRRRRDGLSVKATARLQAGLIAGALDGEVTSPGPSPKTSWSSTASMTPRPPAPEPCSSSTGTSHHASTAASTTATAPPVVGPLMTVGPGT